MVLRETTSRAGIGHRRWGRGHWRPVFAPLIKLLHTELWMEKCLSDHRYPFFVIIAGATPVVRSNPTEVQGAPLIMGKAGLAERGVGLTIAKVGDQ